MCYPDLDTVRSLAKTYSMIPVSMEVYADLETPISVFLRFREQSNVFLLESVEGNEKWARYSFIGRKPFLKVSAFGKKIVHENLEDETKYEHTENPVNYIESIINRYKSPLIHGMPRFSGGAVGFFGYDTVRYFENLSNMPYDDLQLPDCEFMFMNEVIVFDHLKQKIIIIVNIRVEEDSADIERLYNSAIHRINEIYKEIKTTRWKIQNTYTENKSDKKKTFDILSNFSKEEYCNRVNKIKEYIKDGDVFQTVLAQRFYAQTDADRFNVYRALRIINPSPYMYYINFNDYTIVGASPEMLVRVENDMVEVNPIAGTRKRGDYNEEDEKIQCELLQDEKEKSEHIMLVDLGRNDLGKVCEIGSIVVNNLMHIEKFSHVMHIVTNIMGKLRDDKSPFEALTSVLPAGTLSGAPKVRAMEIIDELETVKRGLYGGGICYLGFNGVLDSCIAIRTIIFKNKNAYVYAGAGIVADSNPEKEYEETVNKAKALFKAIEEAGEIK